MNVKTIAKVWSVIEPKFQREFNGAETLSVLTHDIRIWWAWGVNRNTMKNLGGKCLIFKPNARYFKGFVCITLGWEDLYQVHYMSNDYKIIHSVEGVYFDELVNTIDGYIESR